MRKTISIVLIAILLIVGSIACGNAATYTCQALGFLADHPTSMARDINDNGVVVGVALSGYDISSFWWSCSSQTMDSPTPSFNFTVGINSSDQTADQLETYDEYGHLSKCTPYIRNRDGSTHNLKDITGVEHVWLRGLNDHGEVLMLLQYNGTQNGCYALVGENSLTPITVPDTSIDVNSFSNSGIAIFNNKYKWTASGGATILPWLATADEVNITCVNDLGWVAGTMNGHAVRWDAEGNFTDLGIGEAFAINNLGQVVGSVDDQAVLWGIDGGVSYLPLLDGYSSATAAAINDKGQIAGTAWYNGFTTDMAVLWQPVPEPSSLLALFTGLAGIGGVALRRRR